MDDLINLDLQTDERSTYISEFLFHKCFPSLIARWDCCKPGHLLRVFGWWLLIVVEPPRVLLPPGAIQLVPETLTAPLLTSEICRKVALMELLPWTLEVSFWAPTLGGGILCQAGECFKVLQCLDKSSLFLLELASTWSGLVLLAGGMVRYSVEDKSDCAAKENLQEYLYFCVYGLHPEYLVCASSVFTNYVFQTRFQHLSQMQLWLPMTEVWYPPDYHQTHWWQVVFYR